MFPSDEIINPIDLDGVIGSYNYQFSNTVQQK